jgi:isochorismate synthase
MRAERAPSLVVRSEQLSGSPDLLEFFEPDGGFYLEHGSRAIVGIGSALTIVVPGGDDLIQRANDMVRRALDQMETGQGPPPVVVGALPFSDASQAVLTIPRVALIRTLNDGTWKLTIGSPEQADAELVAEAPRALPRASLRVTAVPEPAAYAHVVEAARARIRDGELRKVVLARMLIAQSDHVFDRRAVLARLRSSEPDAYTFAVGGFIGATPELVVAREGDRVRANPLAGTCARAPDPAADHQAARALLASAKDREEHGFVVEAFRDALGPVCEELEVDEEPSPKHTGTLWHLSTEVQGRLRAPISALGLAALLHPTPSVCGTPRGVARAVIRELEQIDRTLYAGLVGWMDARGDGEWAQVLRCAEMQGRIASLFAGAGIVADSDPEVELAETEAKFQAMLSALGYA